MIKCFCFLSLYELRKRWFSITESFHSQFSHFHHVYFTRIFCYIKSIYFIFVYTEIKEVFDLNKRNLKKASLKNICYEKVTHIKKNISFSRRNNYVLPICLTCSVIIFSIFVFENNENNSSMIRITFVRKSCLHKRNYQTWIFC